jgi:hypothetical protein
MPETTASPKIDNRPMDFSEFVQNVFTVIRDCTVATIHAAEDLTGTMLVSVDDETRARLDQMVDAYVVKNRADGLRLLIKSGLKAEQRIFDHIRATEERIRELKQQAAAS